MTRFLTTIALACVLSASVLAGEIPTGGSPTPPPAGTQAANATDPGDGHSPGSQISRAALSALLTVLGLL